MNHQTFQATHRNAFLNPLHGCLLGMLLVVTFQTQAFSNLITSSADDLIRVILKVGRAEGSEVFLKVGGEKFVRELSKNVLEEGGEAMLKRATLLAEKHGSDFLLAAKNLSGGASGTAGKHLRIMIEGAEQLGDDVLRASALRKFAMGSAGRELAEAAGKHGVKVIQAELKHPGLATHFVKTLGEDGLELALHANTSQASLFAKYISELAPLTVSQRGGIVRLLREAPEQLARFIGEFVRQNPGKTLFTASTVTLLLTQSEAILGGNEIVFDAEGNPVVVHKQGFIENLTQQVSADLMRPFSYSLAIGCLVLVVMFGTKWVGFRRKARNA